MFDDNNIKMTRKSGKKQKENPVGFTGEGKRRKGNIREGSREILELSLDVMLVEETLGENCLAGNCSGGNSR